MNTNRNSSIEKVDEPELSDINYGPSNYFSSYLYVVETESFKTTVPSLSATNLVGIAQPKIDVHQGLELTAPTLHGLPNVVGVKRRAQKLKKPYRKRICFAISAIVGSNGCSP